MLLQLLRNRRSIRKYQDRPVEREKLEYVLESALRSPSSRSLNPWQFVVVDDSSTLEALSQVKPHGASFIKNAPLAVAVCGDPKRCDVWIEDLSIATLLLHLAAADVGLGSCWVQIRLRQHEDGEPAARHAARLLELEDGLEVEAIVAMGYPAEEKPGHESDTLLWERIHYGRYGKGGKRGGKE